jgi:hypothetical protein
MAEKISNSEITPEQIISHNLNEASLFRLWLATSVTNDNLFLFFFQVKFHSFELYAVCFIVDCVLWTTQFLLNAKLTFCQLNFVV